MEVSRSGVTGGLLVANRVDWDLSIAFVHAPIPRQQTKEETAWEQLKNLDGVTRVDAQLMEDTRSGLVGLVAVVPVVQETNTVIVPAQIRGQLTED